MQSLLNFQLALVGKDGSFAVEDQGD